MDRVRYAIVGAGISGLAFADWLTDDDYLIFEAEAEIGGYCRTIKQDGFVWDYSGHFFHFKHKDIEAYLVERMADQRVLKVEKKSEILWSRVGEKEGTIDFPFQKNIHQLPKADFIDCLYDLRFRPQQTPENFLEMLYAKFGRSIAEKFLVPYNEKLYATDLRNLDVDAMGRFFPYADEDDIIRNFRRPENASYNATFTYPEGGAIQYVEALAKGVNKDAISLSERVLDVDLERKVLRTSKREVAFEHLISAAPFPKLLDMGAVPYDRDAYSWNQVLVFNLGFDRKGPRDLHWMYVPQRELCFYRVGFYDNIFDTDRMSLYVEIGRPHDAAFSDADVARLKAQVLTDLERAGIVTDHELVSAHHVVLDPAYVHITEASLADVRVKKAQLEGHGVHSIGRYGSWTYCSIEDNIVEARELAERLSATPS